MKTIAELIEEMDTSELDALIDCPKFKAQCEWLIQSIESNQFDLEPTPNKKD